MGTDMRYLIIALLVLVLPTGALAGSQQIRQVVGMAKVQGASDFCASANSTPGTTGVLCEDFEGDTLCDADYPSAPSVCRSQWTTADTAGIVFDGTAGMEVNAYSNADAKAIYWIWTESTGETHELYTSIKLVNIPIVATAKTILTFRSNNGATIVGTVSLVNSSGTVKIQVQAAGGTAVPSITAVTEGTTYNLWVKVVPGTGSNAEMHVAYSTTSTKPTDGSDNYVKSTNGTTTATADSIRWDVEYSSAAQCSDITVDNIFVDNASISGIPQ